MKFTILACSYKSFILLDIMEIHWIFMMQNDQQKIIETLDTMDFCELTKHGLEGYTALHNAAISGYLDVARYLITRGVNINAKDNDGRTALHHAVIHYKLHMVKFLAPLSDCTIVDKEGKDPLGQAIYKLECIGEPSENLQEAYDAYLSIAKFWETLDR